MKIPPHKKRKIELFVAYIKTVLLQIKRFLFSPVSLLNSPYTAAFMTDYEQCKKLSIYNRGVTINGRLKLDLDMSMRHVLCLGSSGSGKSANLFIPTIMSLNYPMLILDAGGGLFKQCSMSLKKRGFSVYQINFASPLSALPYNPLERANSLTPMKKVAHTLVTTAMGKNGGDSAFWNNSATQMCYVLIAVLKTGTNPQYHNLANVRHLLNHLSPDKNSQTYRFIKQHTNDALWSEFLGVISGGDKTIANVLSTLKTALEKIADPELASMTATDALGDLQKLRQKKTAVFLSVKEDEIEYYSFLISLILSDFFAMLMQPMTKKCLPYFLILDEFSQIKIPSFSSIISTMRKHQVSITVCSQTKSMLEHQYGAAEAKSIMYAGCSTHVYMPGQTEQQNNEALSRQLGNTCVRYNGRDVVRPLLTPDEIFSLKDQCIFLQTGSRPSLLDLYPFYKQKKLLKQTEFRPLRYKKRVVKNVPLIDLSPYMQSPIDQLIDLQSHE